jgi:hypothetical protein
VGCARLLIQCIRIRRKHGYVNNSDNLIHISKEVGLQANAEKIVRLLVGETRDKDEKKNSLKMR